MIQKFGKIGSFDEQFGGVKSRINLTIVEEVDTAVQEESIGGVKNV